MLRPTLLASLLVTTFVGSLDQAALGQQPYAATPLAAVASASNPVTTRDVDEEVAKIVDENPTLVRELLVAAGDSEDVLSTIFCLGPAAVKSLLKELDSEDEELRTAAAGALCYACAHEDVPRSEIIKALLAAKVEHEDMEVAELVAFVIRTTRPEVRVGLRAVFYSQMVEEFTGVSGPAPGTRRCSVNGCQVLEFVPVGALPVASEAVPAGTAN